MIPLGIFLVGDSNVETLASRDMNIDPSRFILLRPYTDAEVYSPPGLRDRNCPGPKFSQFLSHDCLRFTSASQARVGWSSPRRLRRALGGRGGRAARRAGS